MIKMTVQEYCLRVGKTYQGANGTTPIATPYALFHACGLKSATMAGQVWKGSMKKIGLQTIEVLCVGLNCTPSDLFEIIPDEKIRKPKPEISSASKQKVELSQRVLKNCRGALPEGFKPKGGVKKSKKGK